GLHVRVRRELVDLRRLFRIEARRDRGVLRDLLADLRQLRRGARAQSERHEQARRQDKRDADTAAPSGHGKALLCGLSRAAGAMPPTLCKKFYRAGTGARSGWTWPQRLHVRRASLASKRSIAVFNSFSMSATCIVTSCSGASHVSQSQTSDSVCAGARFTSIT